MRRRLRTGFYAAAALSLAMLPGIAVAQSVTVIRGSEVSVVQGPGFAEEARREVVPSSSRQRSTDRSSPAPVEPPRQVVVLLLLSTRDTPDTLWRLAGPWKRHGVKAHGMPELRSRSRIRVHGAGKISRLTRGRRPRS
jgi:hypothetical protein